MERKRPLRPARRSGGLRFSADAFSVEVAVDGGAWSFEQVRDLLNGVVAGVVEFLGVDGLLGGELGPAAAFSATGTGGCQPVAGVGDDEFSLQFCQDGEHSEHGSTFGRGGVDALFEHAQADASFLEGGAEGDQVQHGAAKAVEAGDDELIATPVGGGEGLVELRARGFGAAGPIQVNICGVDAGAGEGIDLVIGVLVCGGDARVADKHVSRISATGVFRRCFTTRVADVDWVACRG
jgi:hypothetical protein